MHAFLLAAVLVLGALAGCAAPQTRCEFSRVCMGVRTRVVLYAPDAASGEAAAKLAFREIERLDAMMSDYRPDSELMRLCRAEPGTPLPLSQDLADVLARSLQVSAATHGAFDVTCGPLVALWRETRRTGVRPNPDALREARARSSFSFLSVDRAARTATLAREGMRLDLGGIAKGYAAERAVRTLEQAGFSRALVALAGDVFAADAPPGQPGWLVEIRGDRSTDDSPPLAVLWLRHAGVSTSGDREQHVVIDGVRYSHIVDPHSGMGLSTRRMVTVVSPRGMDADALAKGVCVLGEAQAVELAAAFDAGFCILEPDDAPDDSPARGRTVILDPRGLFRWKSAPR